MPSKKPCRVMVTGAGSGVGQGIVKALRIADLPVTIVSADIDAMNVSLYRADEAVLIPRVESPDALDVIVRLLGDHQINVVLVGSEFDLEFFSVNQKTLQEKTGARVICCPPETVAIANDKWLTAEFLRKQGLPFAESRLVNGADEAVATASEWGFPVVAKARTGTSARHVHVVRSARELQEVWTAIPSPMLQRMVGLPSTELSGEYTCSIFRTASGRVLGPFCARRTLRGGTSWHIEVQRLDEFDSLLLGIGSLLPFEGSLNVQLMMGAGGPIPFELNARFSGTTALRAHFGFNEPEFALRSFYYGEEPEQLVVRRGVAMRYHEEVFIDDVSAAELVVGTSRGSIRRWF